MRIDGINAAQTAAKIEKFPKMEKWIEKAKVDLSDPIDTINLTAKSNEIAESKPSTAKKVGVGVASAFIPGLGQIINHDGKKAGVFFGTSLVGGLLTGAASTVSLPLAVVLSVGTLGVKVASIVDAVKSAK